MRSVAKLFLKSLSFLYGAVVRLRRALYEKGVLKSHDLGSKTISIGNLTVGGTGKTPMVAFAARVLAEDGGARVCVLTRGYGRENPRARVVVSDGEKILADARAAGDEPFELAGKLLGTAAVVADANRAAAGNWARDNLGATAFVLDDGFQHFQVERDCDIVLIDATNPFGNAEILPAGILREALPSLKRADAILITRANLVDARAIANLKLQIESLCPHAKIFVAENRVSKIVSLKDFPARTSSGEAGKPAELITRHSPFTAKKSFAFCALGNPENFFAQLRRENFDLAATAEFRDHYAYAQKDVGELEARAAKAGAEMLLTTGKDAVKLTGLKFEMPCFVVESEVFFDDEQGLREMILK